MVSSALFCTLIGECQRWLPVGFSQNIFGTYAISLLDSCIFYDQIVKTMPSWFDGCIWILWYLLSLILSFSFCYNLANRLCNTNLQFNLSAHRPLSISESIFCLQIISSNLHLDWIFPKWNLNVFNSLSFPLQPHTTTSYHLHNHDWVLKSISISEV